MEIRRQINQAVNWKRREWRGSLGAKAEKQPKPKGIPDLVGRHALCYLLGEEDKDYWLPETDPNW